MTPPTTRQAEPDQACAEAVDLARAAAENEFGPGQVGDHVGMLTEGDRIVTHLFACLNPAYVGWHWAVTVVRAARARVATVSECLLLPGPDSLLAPDWVPWTERVRPGDLKVGDLMPASADDERLVPAVAIVGDRGLLDWEETQPWAVGAELPEGLSAVLAAQTESGAVGGAPGQTAPERPAGAGPAGAGAELAAGRGPVPIHPGRVLSAIGRDEAAVRWYTGEHGPGSPLAAAAPANCLTCGFLIRLSGPLGRVFGVCANEFAPDDGSVVSVDHGCGAHSDGPAVAPAAEAAPTVDDLGYDMMNAVASVPDAVLETIDHELT
ncbi:MAG: DUF3027 domain-containing protein [Streptosporangiaceae bacterium]